MKQITDRRIYQSHLVLYNDLVVYLFHFENHYISRQNTKYEYILHTFHEIYFAQVTQIECNLVTRISPWFLRRSEVDESIVIEIIIYCNLFLFINVETNYDNLLFVFVQNTSASLMVIFFQKKFRTIVNHSYDDILLVYVMFRCACRPGQ